MVVLNMILIFNGLFYYFLWSYLSFVLQIIYVDLSLIQLALFLITSASNPGFPSTEKQFRKNKDGLRYCGKCHLWGEANDISHCELCNICVEGNIFY